MAAEPWSQYHTYDLGTLNILHFGRYLKLFTFFFGAVFGHFRGQFDPRMVGKFRISIFRGTILASTGGRQLLGGGPIAWGRQVLLLQVVILQFHPNFNLMWRIWPF